MIRSLFLVLGLLCASSYQDVCLHEHSFLSECDLATCKEYMGSENWITFQRRIDDTVDFYRGWSDYEEGFGQKHGNFWIGLRQLHKLTKATTKLLVVMEGFDGQKKWAKYNTFMVEGPETKYKLSVSGYSGTAGDSFFFQNAMKFSTKDQDNDLEVTKSCANLFFGGWWYNHCHVCNPNGKYLGAKKEWATGVNWKTYDDTYETSLKSIRMMISV